MRIYSVVRVPGEDNLASSDIPCRGSGERILRPVAPRRRILRAGLFGRRIGRSDSSGCRRGSDIGVRNFKTLTNCFTCTSTTRGCSASITRSHLLDWRLFDCTTKYPAGEYRCSRFRVGLAYVDGPTGLKFKTFRRMQRARERLCFDYWSCVHRAGRPTHAGSGGISLRAIQRPQWGCREIMIMLVTRTATARDSSAVGTVAAPLRRFLRQSPGMMRSVTACVASGVLSRGRARCPGRVDDTIFVGEFAELLTNVGGSSAMRRL